MRAGRECGHLPSIRLWTFRKKSSEVKADTRRYCSWDGVIDQNSGGAKTVSAGAIVFKLDKCDVRGGMLRTLAHN